MRRGIPLLLVVAFVGCATPYQSTGALGGYSSTKLGPRLYQVRFAGNGFTSNDRASEFILRRAAELALENNFRYFTLGDQQSLITPAGGYRMPTVGKPTQSMMVRFLDSEKDDPAAVDAATVVKETDAQTNGALSELARKNLIKLIGGKP